MASVIKVDVCVVGGGPSGSIAALRLTQLGYRVCLIERKAFPRRHIGESLPAAILPLLDLVGLRKKVEAADFLRTRGAIVRWAGKTRYVSEPVHSGRMGFQVDRGRFDELLLNEAKVAGVRVLQPAEARSVKRVLDGGWTVTAQGGNASVGVTANFLIEAGGRDSSQKRRRTSPPTLALFAYWKGARFAGPETRVESGSNHWFWGAPLPDGTFNAAVFADPQSCCNTGGIESLYRKYIGDSLLLQPGMRCAIPGPIKACAATCFIAPDLCDETRIRVGEAAFSVDPLSSQGVILAITSALQASVVIHTIARASDAASMANQFYRDWVAEAVRRQKQFAEKCYAEEAAIRDEPFWHVRSALQSAPLVAHPFSSDSPVSDTQLRLADGVRIVPTAVVRGDFIRQIRAVLPPTQERPTAFVGNIEMVPLLQLIPVRCSLSSLVKAWSQVLPMRKSLELAHYLYRQGWLVRAEHEGKAGYGSQ